MDERQFYQSIQDIIPGEQEVETVSPDTPVSDALDVMRENNFSQLAVVDGDRVQGVFSYRSFAERILDLLSMNPNADQLTVGVFVEEPPFRSGDREPAEIFDDLDRHDAVLVGSRDNMTGIVTAMDVLRHLHVTAEPFVIVAEIEHLIRDLIDACVDAQQLEECAIRALHENPYDDEEDVPRELTDMNMGDYVGIVRHGVNWRRYFGAAFSSVASDLQRKLTQTRIDDARELRNVVFHLKRPLTDEDISALRETRSWLRERRESVRSNASTQTQEDEA
jgi:CBS domain-containing protein